MDNAQRPNFFLLLELHPNLRWDPVHFEKKLREKRSAWSRESAGVAKKALVARQNLALMPLIQEVMTDHEARNKEAAAARKILAALYQEEYARFEQQLTFLNAREVLEQEEVNTFVAAFAHLFGEQEILSRLQAKIATTPSSPGKSAQLLDPSLTSAINDRLHFLRMKSLYELLSRPRTTSTQELYKAAQQLYARLVIQPSTAETTAQIELAGFARDVFRSEDVRVIYDASLRQQSLHRLLKDLDEIMSRSSSKELHHGQVMVFLEQARRGGCLEQEALESLKEHGRLRKWIMTIPMLSPELHHLCCPNCEHVNASNQHYCTHCKQELTIICPMCQQTASCEAISCGTCGFSVGNRYLVDHLLETLDDTLKSGDLVRAEEMLQEIGEIWPASVSNTRTQKINNLMEALHQRAEEHQQTQKQAATLHEQLQINGQSGPNGRLVHITWHPPDAGAVGILRSACDLERQGQILTHTEADQIGRWLTGGKVSTTDDWRFGEVTYYTPVILLQERAFFGASLPYVCIDNVSHLTHQQFGSTLRLRWHWPELIQEVLISYHQTGWPQLHSSGVQMVHVQKIDYERLGYYDLQDVYGEPLYIIAYSLVPANTGSLLAQGTKLMVRGNSRTVLAYNLKPATFLNKKCILHLTVDPPRPLPALLLIRKPGGVPLSKADGSLLQRLEPTVASRKSINVGLSAGCLQPGTFVKVFLEDDDAYSEIIVHHPDKEQLRLR
jgi:hypothetical protein